MWDQRLKCWNTMARRVRIRSTCFRSAGTVWLLRFFLSFMCSPPTYISPAVGISNRFIHRRKVLLPEPLDPMSEMTSPSFAETDIPFSTLSWPKSLWRDSTLIASFSSVFTRHPCMFLFPVVTLPINENLHKCNLALDICPAATDV